jgi:DNA (cytosine-5)-methyltransferase 1
MVTGGVEMTHLDLFTGIGGFHLASEWAGFETVGFSEVEPYCCELLKDKWPHIPNYGDLRTADFSDLRGRITVLSAGIPCQPASLAGKRRGAADDRWLWPATLDVVELVKPAWCIFENPDGILSLDEFGGILLRMGTLGYEVRMFRVPANAVGARHRRYRVFIVAHSDRYGIQWRWGVNGGRDIEARAHSQTPRPGQDTIITSETVANAARELREWSGNARTRGRDESSDSSETVADTKCNRLQRNQRQSGPTDLRRRFTDSGEPTVSEQAIKPGESRELCGNGIAVPEFRRMADGLPNRPHEPWKTVEMPAPLQSERIQNRSNRLKALGNSVVPQQAFPFFEAIAKVETMSSTGPLKRVSDSGEHGSFPRVKRV